ncbi:MAG: biopolymer transporter ExbD [Verrucomicrobiae bacterium]|nr:biopolymer transporter ExbD [Verrucomicrobiae bacterium]
MASHKLHRLQSEQGEELNLDMSPMIDLVFLLLIFFMVSSHMIIVRIDQNVKPPTADNAQVAENAHGRIVVNVYGFQDELAPDLRGKIFDNDENELVTSDQITDYVDRAAQRVRESEANLTPRLHLRADKTTDTRLIKKVVQASAAAGVSDVIFGSFVVER